MPQLKVDYRVLLFFESRAKLGQVEGGGMKDEATRKIGWRKKGPSSRHLNRLTFTECAPVRLAIELASDWNALSQTDLN